jgi:Putative MetA-pathway of phenol degradation
VLTVGEPVRLSKRVIVTTIALVVCMAPTQTAAAQQANDEDACADRFVPDRPGATNGHTTVGAGCLHAATSFSTTVGGGSTALTFPSIVRLGLGQPFELRLAHSIIGLEWPSGDTLQTSAAPLGMELKWMAIEADGHAPGTGVLVGAAAPTNSDFSRQITPSVSWLFDWAFVDPLGFSLNLVTSLPGAADGERRATRFDFGSVLSTSIPVPGDWLGAYIDTAGGSALRDGSWSQSIGTGLAFRVLDNMQLDASTSLEVTGDAQPVTFGAGLAWRL